jgi:hypothetical protein
MVTPDIILMGGDLAAGPNPVAKTAGLVNFYRQGKQVKNALLLKFMIFPAKLSAE